MCTCSSLKECPLACRCEQIAESWPYKLALLCCAIRLAAESLSQKSSKCWGHQNVDNPQDCKTNVRQVFVFFLVSIGFVLRNHQCMSSFLSLFVIIELWTLTLTEVTETETCSSLNIVLGSFVTFLMSRWCVIGVILEHRTPLGKFAAVPCSPHLWIMALWFSQNLRNGSVTLSRMIDANDFVFQMFLSLDHAIMCCFLTSFSLFHFVRQILFKWLFDSTDLAVIRPERG